MDITPSITHYLQHIKVPLRLACTTLDGWPIVISLWYIYDDGMLYCATQSSAKVVQYLNREPRCGFEIASDQPPYCGIRGQALAHIDNKRGNEILERLLIRYLGGIDNPLGHKLLRRKSPEVALCLTPKQMFTWNYTRRMQDVVQKTAEKVCP